MATRVFRVSGSAVITFGIVFKREFPVGVDESCTGMITPPIPSSMIFSDLQLVDENLSWRLVLQSYRTLELESAEARATERKKAKATQQPDRMQQKVSDDTQVPSETLAEDRWNPRLPEVDGVSQEELSSIHGFIIGNRSAATR